MTRELLLPSMDFQCSFTYFHTYQMWDYDIAIDVERSIYKCVLHGITDIIAPAVTKSRPVGGEGG